jgi:hypothetical protein
MINESLLPAGHSTLRKFASAVLLAALAPLAHATTYYLNSSTGSDSNSGTSSSAPWATLAKASGRTYAPGDQILFACGCTFTGQLYTSGSGTSGNPITINSYGSGAKPIIQANGTKHNTLYFYNQQYWEIYNLEVTNNAGTAASNLADLRAIGIQGQDAGTLNHYVIENCYIHNVTGWVKWIGGSTSGNSTGITFATGWDASKMTGGIVFWITTSTNVKTNFNDITIENNQIENCSMVGVTLKQWDGTDGWAIRTSATDSNWTPHTNVTIKGNYFTQNGTSYGCDAIYVTDTKNATVEDNVIAGCGTCGVEMYYADSIAVADNEVFNVTKKAGGGDANGIDPDTCTTNITVEYNYSHGNQSQGMLLFQVGGFGSSVVRYNIFQDNTGNAIWCDSASGSTSSIYNNVFYNNVASQQMVTGSATGTFTFNNNIFYSSASGATFSSTGITYAYNCYYGTSMTYPTDAHAVKANPLLVNPGSGGSGGTGGTANATLTGYKLQSGSPCINAGVAIANNGGIDFFGDTLPSGAHDIGAHQL